MTQCIADILEANGAIGKENRMYRNEIMHFLQIESAREFWKLFAAERRRGALICSTKGDGGGYYLPKDNDEIERCCRRLRREGAALYEAAKRMEAALEVPEGQQELDLDGGSDIQ